MKRRSWKVRSLALAGAVAGVASSHAYAQIANLDKGHSLFLSEGLQILGGVTDTRYSFDYNNATGANLTGVLWGFPAYGYDGNTVSVLSAGQKWGRELDYHSNPDTVLSPTEIAHQSDLTFIQVGDEQQGDIEASPSATAQWFQTAQAHNDFPNTITYINSAYINSDAAYANFIATANPDAISFDSYPFSNPAGYYITPSNWLSKASQFRSHALGSYIGATGNSPRPYGLYVQTYYDSYAITPGEAEIRWQQFTAWTMGYSWVDAFIYDGGNNVFSSKGDGGTLYNAFSETAREGKNLGPALTHLISTGSGTSIIPGKNSDGSGRGVPGGWLSFAQNNAPTNQRYLTNVSAANIGTKNNGQPGDVYVGFFNPLLNSFGNQDGEAYFMVTNGLGGDLTLPNGSADNTATAAQTQQNITLTFNLSGTGITSLERLSRNDGTVQTIPLLSLGGGLYQYTFTIDGGTGDLFKFNDGSPFVGVQSLSTMYWDKDASATGNSTASGASMGGTGTWDSSAKWYDGSAESSYSGSRDAIFWGSAGTVTLASAQTANSLTFKTDGYNLAGSTLTLTGSFITVDSGVTAAISSQLAGSMGIVKTGYGTLNLTSANTYTGGTTINEGVLGIGSSSLGANPTSPQINVTINNGATLRFNVNNLTVAANRQFQLGGGGGTIDTNGFNSTIAGTITGTGFNEIGGGTLALTGTSTYTGGTTVSASTLRVSADSNLGAVPASLSPNIDLEGGTLQFGASFDPNSNRVINLGTAGGTIDTNGFSTVSGFGIANSFQGGDLTKTGDGTFFAKATTGGLNKLWTGNLIIKQGTWKIVATDGLPYNPLDGFHANQVTLDGGTWQLGANIFASNANRGIAVAAGGGTIDTQGFSDTWAGPLSGSVSSATLTKIGSGLFRFNSSTNSQTNPNPFNGTLSIAGGSVQLDGGTAIGDLASISLANTSGVGLRITSGNEIIGSLAGGGAAGGNVSLGAITLTTGGNNASTTFGGVISGAGASLVKNGAGTFTLSAANSYTGGTTVTGGTLSLKNTNALSIGPINLSNGALALSIPMTLTNSLSITGSGTIDTAGNNSTYAGSITTAGNFTKTGAGQFKVANVRTGGLTVNGGTLAIAAGGGNGGTSVVNSLNVTGTLDLADHSMIVNYSGASPIASIRSELASAYNNGAWNGTGITSSAAANDTTFHTAVAYAEASNLGLANGGTFAGQTIPGQAVVMKYTYFGDSDLDGKVTLNDFSIFVDGFNGLGTGWVYGDYDYNGVVDLNDFALFVDSYKNQNGSSLSQLSDVISSDSSLSAAQRSAMLSVVPEPSCLSLLLVPLALKRRRRRS